MITRPHDPERGASRVRRAATAVAALGTVAVAATGATLIATSAAGASTAAPAADHASLAYAWENSSTHTLHIRGYAYDKRSRRSTPVRVYVDGRFVHTSAAHNGSPAFDRSHHITGKHGLKSVFRVPAGARSVSLEAGTHTLATERITQYRDTGAHVVAVARTHVGATYRYGAVGPRAFDCSGYAKYVYAHADVATLPHNSESQRHAKHMHTISRKSARPGDLVFYLSGGDAYHVAIYAGHGKQYSATNPSRGVEYSSISSSHVVFGTDWH